MKRPILEVDHERLALFLGGAISNAGPEIGLTKTEVVSCLLDCLAAHEATGNRPAMVVALGELCFREPSVRRLEYGRLAVELRACLSPGCEDCSGYGLYASGLADACLDCDREAEAFEVLVQALAWDAKHGAEDWFQIGYDTRALELAERLEVSPARLQALRELLLNLEQAHAARIGGAA